MNESIYTEVNRLNPSPIVELYELDATPLGEDSILYFHNGTNGIRETVSFLGQDYTPLPILVKGFDVSSTGEPPRPTMTIMNIGGFMSSLILGYSDLVGAKLTRRRTFAKYLDGQPTAKNVQFPADIFYIEQKIRENRQLVEFELGTGLDLDGFRFPVRQVVSGYCAFDYRGTGCTFAETRIVTDNKNAPFKGSDQFKKEFDSTKTYSENDTVSYEVSGYYCIYQANTASPSGVPGVSGDWTRVQRYRGLHSKLVTDYIIGDVVYIENNEGYRIFAIAIAVSETGYVPTGLTPPNYFYWTTDRCGKFLQQCMLRYDPENVGLRLRYGGFPGTLNLPEV